MKNYEEKYNIVCDNYYILNDMYEKMCSYASELEKKLNYLNKKYKLNEDYVYNVNFKNIYEDAMLALKIKKEKETKKQELIKNLGKGKDNE